MEQVILLMRHLSEDRDLLERFRADEETVFSEYGLSKNDVIVYFEQDCRKIIGQFPTDHLALSAVVTSGLSFE